MSNKRNAEEMGADVFDTTENKKKCVEIEKLFFFFFTAASCGLCQGCDLCHPEECAPEKANAIKKKGIIYKQVGHGFDLTFASLTCLFIRMYKSFKSHSTPTTKDDHEGRLKVTIRDDNGVKMKSQALKFGSLAWGQVSQLAKVSTAGMLLRDFKRAFQVDHIDGNPSNNDVSNGLIMTKAEHKAKTRPSAAQIAKQSMSQSAPCTMTVFDLEGNPLLDSESKPIVENYPHRKEVMDDYKLKKTQIINSIAYEDTTWNSLVEIKYNGQDCLAQFSWYDLPDLEGEIWKPVTEDDHKTLELPIPPLTEYYVSNLARFKFVTKSTQNAKIRDFRGQERPRILLMKKNLLFYRAVALVFHREQMNEYIAEQKAKTGIIWTFATLEVDHIDFNPENHCANNLQFLTPEENKQRSHSRPCIIWEIGKEDAEIEYTSITDAAKGMGYESHSSVHTILKNNTHPKWRGEYIVK